MFDATIENNGLLPKIREGMQVRDSGGEAIGKVQRVQMGGGNDPVDAEEQSREAAGPDDGPNDVGGTALATNLVTSFFADDSMPEEERQNLQRKGFIEIDSKGFFSANRYATTDQIASVEGDDVVLNVTSDNLVEAR